MKKLLGILVACAVFSTSCAFASSNVTHHYSQQAAAQTSVININKADSAQLQSLKGIGPKRAEQIIAYRTAHGKFNRIAQLVNIHGIGQKALARLKKENSGRIVL